MHRKTATAEFLIAMVIAWGGGENGGEEGKKRGKRRKGITEDTEDTEDTENIYSRS